MHFCEGATNQTFLCGSKLSTELSCRSTGLRILRNPWLLKSPYEHVLENVRNFIFFLTPRTNTSFLKGDQSAILKDEWRKGARSDWINIPESLLFKIIIGYSGSPTGRKMKPGVGGDEHSSSLTDGQTDERNGRQVQNTLELWPQGWYTAVLHFKIRKWKENNLFNTCRLTHCGQR